MFKQNVLSETSCIKGRCHLKRNSRTIYYIASGSLFLPVATNEISGGQLALGWPGKEQVVTEQKAQPVQVGAHRNPGSHSLAHSYLLPHHSMGHSTEEMGRQPLFWGCQQRRAYSQGESACSARGSVDAFPQPDNYNNKNSTN